MAGHLARAYIFYRYGHSERSSFLLTPCSPSLLPSARKSSEDKVKVLTLSSRLFCAAVWAAGLLLQSGCQFFEHVLRHAVEVVLRFPVPLLAGADVVETVGPAVGNALLERVDVVYHFELGHVLLDGGVDALRVEAHGGNVEAVAVAEARGVGFHQLHAGVEGVGHVHHVHVGALADGAGELFAAHGAVVDVDGVVGRAAARRRHVGDEAGEAHRARVDAIFVVVVVGKQFGGHLAHAVDGAGALNGVLRRVVGWRFRAERADGTGGEDGTIVLARHFEDVPESVNTDFPRQLGAAFSDHAEQCGEVEDGVGVVLADHVGNLFAVGDVANLVGTALAQLALRLGAGNVATDNVVVAINAAQFHCQLRANLTSGSDYQNVLHCPKFYREF